MQAGTLFLAHFPRTLDYAINLSHLTFALKDNFETAIEMELQSTQLVFPPVLSTSCLSPTWLTAARQQAT